MGTPAPRLRGLNMPVDMYYTRCSAGNVVLHFTEMGRFSNVWALKAWYIIWVLHREDLTDSGGKNYILFLALNLTNQRGKDVVICCVCSWEIAMLQRDSCFFKKKMQERGR